MSDEADLWTVADEPSTEEFEAAEREAPPSGARVTLVRILRLVVAVAVVAALLVYFVAPYQNMFSTWYRWRPPQMRLRTIPLAPEPTSTPLLPA